MPFVSRDGVRIYWRLQGAAGNRPLVLVNSLGTDMSMFDSLAALLPDLLLLRIDTRGHGASDVPAGDYSLDQLSGDVLAAMDAAGIAKANLCGVSLGGMVCMHTALAAPQRVSSLSLACTTAEVPAAPWDARIKMVREGGMAVLVDMVMSRYFTDEFRAAHPDVAGTAQAFLQTQDPAGYAGCCAAIRDMHLLPKLGAIACPTVVIGGARDISTPFEDHGRKIAAAIPGATTVLLDTAHLACLEDPQGFAAAVRSVLA